MDRYRRHRFRARKPRPRPAGSGQASWRAAPDPVTGLPGPSALVPHIRAAVARAAARREGLVLVVLDVDRLREINLLLGYSAGDELLAAVARELGRLSGTRPFRMSGDRFALLFPGTAEEAEGVLQPRLAHTLRLRETVLEVGLSAGIAVFPEHGRDVDALLRAAELALDEAKAHGGRRIVVFDPHLELRLRRRKFIEGALRRAIETRSFALHFQPQFELASGAVVGVEALLRWLHDGEEVVGPGEFIPVAEQTGLIRPLGAWLFDEACRMAGRLRREGFALPISVNVSPVQLRQPDIVDMLRESLARHGLPPAALELEVTEGLFVDPAQTAIRRNLDQLFTLGVRFALDDFGTGYSSLAYLKRLPAWRIKIDRSFVQGLGEVAEDEKLVGTIVQLGRVFGKRILAEGVERERQQRVLAVHGCDEAQGFLLARPMEADRLVEFLHRRGAGGGTPAG